MPKVGDKLVSTVTFPTDSKIRDFDQNAVTETREGEITKVGEEAVVVEYPPKTIDEQRDGAKHSIKKSELKSEGSGCWKWAGKVSGMTS